MARLEDDEESLIARLLGDVRKHSKAREPGALLIGRQPWRGPLAHLHIFYSGLDEAGVDELERLYGRAMPPRLRAFYERWNGLSLFEGSVSIYGLVRHFTRDPEAHNPLDPKVAAHCFPGFHPEWHRLGYFAVGGIALFTRRAIIACDAADRVVLLRQGDEAALRRYADLFEALAMISTELAAFWDEKGALRAPEEALDRALLAGGRAGRHERARHD